MSENILEMENVSKIFKLGETSLEALRSVSFNVKQGEFTAVVGPSGSGKSTLLHLAAGLDKPSQGQIRLMGRSLPELSDKEQAKVRNKRIGFIFQTFNLIPVLSVRENIEYPCVIYGDSRKNKDRVDLLLEELGIADHHKKKPSQLSGGQRQRVAIARALVNNPNIIFADEPTANLDHKTGVKIMELMQKMNEKYNATFIFSTHDPKIMERATRLVYLEDGVITEDTRA